MLATLVITLLGPGALGSAGAIPNGTTQTVDGVAVTKTGGITAWGTVDCTAEVTAYFADLGTPIPADTMVLANESWVAYQAVGRKTMLQATYQSHYANPCYSNTAEPPYPWMTSQYDSSDTPFYVYSSNGVFKTGAVHIDLTTDGGHLIVNGEYQGKVMDVYHVSGFDLRATRSGVARTAARAPRPPLRAGLP
ncbi:MAG: hypothetical protein ACKOA9_02715 [Actinomycetota bacterium]